MQSLALLISVSVIFHSSISLTAKTSFNLPVSDCFQLLREVIKGGIFI